MNLKNAVIYLKEYNYVLQMFKIQKKKFESPTTD